MWDVGDDAYVEEGGEGTVRCVLREGGREGLLVCGCVFVFVCYRSREGGRGCLQQHINVCPSGLAYSQLV